MFRESNRRRRSRSLLAIGAVFHNVVDGRFMRAHVVSQLELQLSSGRVVKQCKAVGVVFLGCIAALFDRGVLGLLYLCKQLLKLLR